jgi:hypothetical protein
MGRAAGHREFAELVAVERASVTEGRMMFKGCGEVDDRDAACSDVDDAVGTHRARARKQLRRRCVRCLQRQSNTCRATTDSCSFVSESKLP